MSRPTADALTFRKDINGIRALAVLSVVLFHFYPQWFAGGFAGVDMFYVISGYLMTRIILSRLDSGSFQLRAFYFARARRIVPALTVMSLVVLAYARLNTSQALRYDIAGDIAASLSFISNIVYWQDAGYFDAASIHKWLLHTWSLSVEWQFYLSYPVLLILLYKTCAARTLRLLLLAVLAGSFAFSLWLSVFYPSAAFYLLPTRLWQLLAGAMLVLFPVNVTRPALSHTLFVIGLLLLVSCNFVNDSTQPWPGMAALLPVLGVLAILIASSRHSMLDLAVFQGLGKWSYSIYLWHWPVVALGYYRPGISFLPWQLDLVGWSILLGFASYHLVEKPRMPKTHLALYAVALVWALYLHAVSAVSAPVLTDFTVYDQGYCEEINQQREDTCRVWGDSQQLDFIVWGDSHAINLTQFLGASKRYNFVSFAVPGCPPFNAVRRRDQGGGAVSCNSGINDDVFQKITSTDASQLLLIARWSLYVTGQIIDGRDTHHLCRADSDCLTGRAPSPLQSFVELFRTTLAGLPPDLNIIVVRGTPILPQPGKYYLVGIGDTLSLDQHRAYQAEVDAIIDQLQGPRVQILDAAPLLFDDDGNLVIHQGNQFYYLDDNHLTVYGWQRITQRFLPMLQHALENAAQNSNLESNN